MFLDFKVSFDSVDKGILVRIMREKEELRKD